VTEVKSSVTTSRRVEFHTRKHHHCRSIAGLVLQYCNDKILYFIFSHPIAGIALEFCPLLYADFP
jgi:hypothetical protein